MSMNNIVSQLSNINTGTSLEFKKIADTKLQIWGMNHQNLGSHIIMQPKINKYFPG